MQTLTRTNLPVTLRIFAFIFILQNGNPDKDAPVYNAQDLEDCDSFPEDSFSLTRFDGELLKPTEVVGVATDRH